MHINFLNVVLDLNHAKLRYKPIYIPAPLKQTKKVSFAPKKKTPFIVLHISHSAPHFYHPYHLSLDMIIVFLFFHSFFEYI